MCAIFAITWICSGTWVSGLLAVAFLVCHQYASTSNHRLCNSAELMIIFFSNDVTRVAFTVSLREHFSLPFIFAQFAVVGLYLDSNARHREVRFRSIFGSWTNPNLFHDMVLSAVPFQKTYLITVFGLTFLYGLTWQFAQFVTLLQCVTLFGLATIELVDKDKVRSM